MADVREMMPRKLKSILKRWKRATEQKLDSLFFERLIRKTENFTCTWLGELMLQNILDLWTIQETIFKVSPTLLIECGTYQGGSAYFYACIFDLMGRGEVLTIDTEKRHNLSHPRIEFLQGSSVSGAIAATAKKRALMAQGPVMVILDSDHGESHVFHELETYCPLVTPGSFLLVQDGVIDTLPRFRPLRPGPLPAIERFLKAHPEFEVDKERCGRFLITHHPLGWLRRKS
jgi:cephalosporin hydroxylase